MTFLHVYIVIESGKILSLLWTLSLVIKSIGESVMFVSIHVYIAYIQSPDFSLYFPILCEVPLAHKSI